MAALPRTPLNKIPAVTPTLKQDNSVKDLTTLTRLELLDLKERHGKLLANKVHLNRLPDKGKRVQLFYDKVTAELEHRHCIDEAVLMFSELNVASTGQHKVNRLEWSGRLNGVNGDESIEDVLDSDDEADLDPLHVIAQRTMHERRVQMLPPEEKLVTEADLADIASFKTEPTTTKLELTASTPMPDNETADEDKEVVHAEIFAMDVREKLPNLRPKMQHISENHTSAKVDSNNTDTRSSTPAMQEVEQHVRFLVNKTEMQTAPQREKFKPYQTTISDVHDPEKERARKKGKHWEVTAATPPLIQHSGAKMLTLLDSVELQADYLAKMKKLQEQQARERLAARCERLNQHKLLVPSDDDLKTNPAFTTHRASTVHIEGEPRFRDEDEMHDILDEEGDSGGVTYTVYS